MRVSGATTLRPGYDTFMFMGSSDWGRRGRIVRIPLGRMLLRLTIWLWLVSFWHVIQKVEKKKYTSRCLIVTLLQNFHIYVNK